MTAPILRFSGHYRVDRATIRQAWGAFDPFPAGSAMATDLFQQRLQQVDQAIRQQRKAIRQLPDTFRLVYQSTREALPHAQNVVVPVDEIRIQFKGPNGRPDIVKVRRHLPEAQTGFWRVATAVAHILAVQPDELHMLSQAQQGLARHLAPLQAEFRKARLPVRLYPVKEAATRLSQSFTLGVSAEAEVRQGKQPAIQLRQLKGESLEDFAKRVRQFAQSPQPASTLP